MLQMEKKSLGKVNITPSTSHTITYGTVYPKKYAHGFVVLCFVVVMQSFIMNWHEVFIHIHHGCFAGTGAIVRLPQCQWSKPDGYGKISQCITTTKQKPCAYFLGYTGYPGISLTFYVDDIAITVVTLVLCSVLYDVLAISRCETIFWPPRYFDPGSKYRNNNLTSPIIISDKVLFSFYIYLIQYII